MYRQRETFLLFDPWLLPWFAESNVPSLWGSLLPRPAAIFLTHDHDDHVDPRTLLHMPKDIPVIIPSRRNRKKLFYDYTPLLKELGFSHLIELAHGETWTFDGGAVVSVPFFGEDPCDLEMPRNCYLITDRDAQCAGACRQRSDEQRPVCHQGRGDSGTRAEIRPHLSGAGFSTATPGNPLLCRARRALESRSVAGGRRKRLSDEWIPR